MEQCTLSRATCLVVLRLYSACSDSVRTCDSGIERLLLPLMKLSMKKSMHSSLWSCVYLACQLLISEDHGNAMKGIGRSLS